MRVVKGKVWRVADVDSVKAGPLAEELNIPLPLASVLVRRGIESTEDAEQFLSPRLSELSDPFLLPDMRKAVDRLWDAVDRCESILVFGDYDVDGVSSTALMVSFLSELGAMVTPFLPNRSSDGYGLTIPALERCSADFRPSLIVTVDCGTTSVESVCWAQERDIDVIVTDHHKASGTLAPALALVNPKLGDNDRVSMLAGVGVAFKLCHAMLKQGRLDQRDNVASVELRRYMDFVALGTISDIVPLVHENRTLASYGLGILNKTRCIGLRQLMDVAGVRGEVDAYHIGFQLGPRLNAAGRMGTADLALELLLTEDEGRARAIALRLDASNRERQDVEKRIFRTARERIEESFDPEKDFGLVVGEEGWHPGVIGIVASRLCSAFRRPVVVLGFDENGKGRGSCRSVEGFDLVHHLGNTSEFLSQYGGHAMAAGLELERDNLDAFRVAFNREATEKLAGSDLRQVQAIDAWVDLAEADNRLFESSQRIRPFGHSNPTPVWASQGVRVVGEPRVVGKHHIRMRLASDGVQMDAIGFGLGDREVPPGLIDIAYQLRMNDFQGRQSLQLNLQDFRASEL